MPRLTVFACVVAVTAVSAYQPSSSQRRDSAPRPAAEALSTFVVPPGYRVELVASEPLIQDPIFIDWDADGRLWAIELPGYMRDLKATGEYDPVGRIVVLDDLDGDGDMDTRAVFSDGLVQPRALKVLDRGVLVGEPPNVWLLTDADGDLRADTRDLVTTGYGRRETNVEVNANGLLVAMDNRVHVAGTGADMYLEWKDGRLEARKSLSRGQWGLTQDDAGRIYRNHNESVLHADLVPTFYFARNPNLLRTRGSHEVLADPDGNVNTVWPARATPGTNRAYQHGILRDDGTLAAFTAACAPTVYRGDRLPSELVGNVFVAEPAAHFVSRLIVQDDGTTLRARKAYARAEFVASTDERFRPVYLSSAPDGTLYIVDMYRGVVQHRAYITEHLRDHIRSRDLDKPTGLGRIYRVVHETTRRGPPPRLSNVSRRGLVETLSHPNGWWRDTAQRLLVERWQKNGSRREKNDEGSVAALRKLLEAADWRTRLHALWTLDGIQAIDQAAVLEALRDPVRDVRTSAVRLSERWLADATHPVRKAVLDRADDPDWAVRQQVAASIGLLPASERAEAAVMVLERHGDQSIVLDSTISGLRGIEANVLTRLLHPGSRESAGRDAAIAALAATVIRSGQESAVQDLFARAADGNLAAWQRSALLRGAEIALLGAPMPGSAPVRRDQPASAAAAPCPTCPGGRAGPGGAYAYRTEQDVAANAAASPAGRGNRLGLVLTREPAALTAWPTAGDQMAGRVAKLLERIRWPGKSGEPAALVPLTADEARRFEAGREIYQNICQACHQTDGQGQDRLAPTLIESALTLAAADVPIRILLNGKEGPVGLMPPIGSTFADEQIAAVLTYVRREWGQTGSAVDPATVAKVRSATAGRTRPWTDAELQALAARPGQRPD